MPTVAEPSSAPFPPGIDTLGPLLLDGAWGRQARDYLGRAREVLFEQHQAGASGGAIVAAWTAVVDHVVRALYEAARASYAERYTVLDQRVAIVAQGGYGRARAQPVLRHRPARALPAAARRLRRDGGREGALRPVGHRPHRRSRAAQPARLRQARRQGPQGQDGAARHALPGRRSDALRRVRRHHGARSPQAQRGALLPRQGGGERGAPSPVRRLGLPGRAADQGGRGRSARHPHRHVARQGEVRRARPARVDGEGRAHRARVQARSRRRATFSGACATRCTS